MRWRSLAVRLVLLYALATLLLPATAAPAEALRVAIAADLINVAPELGAAFRARQPGVHVEFSAGASGNLHAQILQGAPFDVFMAADLATPRALIAAGMAEAATLRVYAMGTLVLWSRRADLDLGGGLAILRSPQIRRIAIANPDVAPYGQAARSALMSAGVWDSVQARLVQGDNVAQAAAFVASGNADVGLVSAASVLAPSVAALGRHVLVPAPLHPAIEQGVVLTRRGRDNALARAWLEFLHTREARQIFARYGFKQE